MNALANIPLAPLSQPSIDGILECAKAARALGVVVHNRGAIDEVGIWQHGEWVGSVVRHPKGGLGAWSSIGDHFGTAYSIEDAVRIALYGHGKLRLSEPTSVARRSSR